MTARKTTDYIYTFSGQAIYPPEVRSEQILLQDIAYGLAGIMRYNGQTRVSVLRHSLALSTKADSPEGEQWALLHDAAEAYMMDVPVPQKPYMNEEWRDLYAYFETLIFEKFRVQSLKHVEATKLAQWDKLLVEYEMDSRDITEHGSMFRYPAARRLTDEEIIELHATYAWHLTDDQLIPIFIDKVKELEVFLGFN